MIPMSADPQRTRATPSRFVIARMRRGLLTWQVADALGMKRERLHDIEKGRCCATKREVTRISDHLRFKPLWFYRPHLELPRWTTL